jgi:hypothetical protein
VAQCRFNPKKKRKKRGEQAEYSTREESEKEIFFGFASSPASLSRK